MIMTVCIGNISVACSSECWRYILLEIPITLNCCFIVNINRAASSYDITLQEFYLLEHFQECFHCSLWFCFENKSLVVRKIEVMFSARI